MISDQANNAQQLTWRFGESQLAHVYSLRKRLQGSSTQQWVELVQHLLCQLFLGFELPLNCRETDSNWTERTTSWYGVLLHEWFARLDNIWQFDQITRTGCELLLARCRYGLFFETRRHHIYYTRRTWEATSMMWRLFPIRMVFNTLSMSIIRLVRLRLDKATFSSWSQESQLIQWTCPIIIVFKHRRLKDRNNDPSNQPCR